MEGIHTVLPEAGQVLTLEQIKRDELKATKPLVYRKMQRYHENAFRGVISPTIRLAWSYLCNFTCEHCCAEERMDRTLGPKLVALGKQDTRRRMNYEDLARVAEEFDEYGIFRFVLTGGEPTTWPDLKKVVQILDPNRHLVIMDSNGWLLAERPGSVQSLADMGVYKMQVSLDSFDRQEHDVFRSKPGSYDRVMKVLPEIINSGMKLLVSTCLTRDRAFSKEFEDLARFCKGLGAMLYVTYAKPTGTCGERHEDWVITKEDADRIRLLEETLDITTHMTPSFMRLLAGALGSQALGQYDGCITVKGINTLEPWGDLTPCPYMDVAFGNIFDDSIATILQRGMMIRDLGPNRSDCLIGENTPFIRRHGEAVKSRRAAGDPTLPIPWGEFWTDKDLIQIQTR